MGDPVGPGRVDGAAPPVLTADPITRVGAAAGPVAAAAECLARAVNELSGSFTVLVEGPYTFDLCSLFSRDPY